jgi:cytochrome bd ubiquinol oxidase subunit I
MDATTWSRYQFAFLATFHYLFPALTMGLALLIYILKLIAYKKGDEDCAKAAKFWAKIFGVNFAVGVVTGIPLEFQFGTNWAQFSNFAGGVIGLTLAMEGMFAFFAESVFLGLFLYGEHKLSKKAHLFTSFMVFVGSWLSGYFIVATNAFMQHPVGYTFNDHGQLQLSNALKYLFNEWALVQYSHNMMSSVITACFVVLGVSSYFLLTGKHEAVAKSSMRVSTIVALISCILVIFPTGDRNGKMVAKYQAPGLAAMEGRFEGGPQADIALIGQPDMEHKRLDNALRVPAVLSYLAYGTFGSDVKGMNEFDQKDLPDNVELLYFAYHIMAGLGTLFILISCASVIMARRGTLYTCKPMLWILLCAVPFPYIATSMGWITAEIGRQPWIVYGLQRTRDAASPLVTGGNVAFSALGFMGMYLLIGMLFLYLEFRIIAAGPEAPTPTLKEHAA